MSAPAVVDAEVLEPAVVAPRLPRLKPRERQIAELHWEGLTNREIGRRLNRRADTVAKILRAPDVQRWLAVMDERGQVRLAEKRVGARAILRASEEEFAHTFVDGVRKATRPMDKVLAGEKGLGLLGIVAPKEVHSTVEVRLKKLSDEEVRAWAEDGRVPPVFAEYAALPSPPEGNRDADEKGRVEEDA